MWLLSALISLSSAVTMLQHSGNTVELTYYFYWDFEDGHSFVQNLQYTSNTVFADTQYTSIVCMHLINNETMKEGDYGAYVHLTEKTLPADMSAHITWV